MILILFTDSFPYEHSAEQTFLEREVPYLVKNIEKIIIVPKLSKGKLVSFPPGIEVDENFAVYYKKNTGFFSMLFHAIRSPYFYKEIRTNLFLVFNPVKLARLILFLGRAIITRRWAVAFIDTLAKIDDQILLYSYWFDDITMGLSLVKREIPQVLLVSRAHGYDIYEEQYFPYYWPFRREIFANLDKLFPASNDGREYFCSHYPEFFNLFETAHLGVNDPGFLSTSSTDGVLRIVSCAHIVSLKRIDLLLEGIALAARIRPEQNFEWHHFGDGKDRKTLQDMATKSFPSNAQGYLPGYVPNQDVMDYYREDPVDVFVNLSTTEGGAPVSIQEAISCGIPVIATNVGGNPEIVSKRNGILLGENPTPDDVAQALLKIYDDPQSTHLMRQESRRVWEESYNAEVNFRNFAEKLVAIRQG